MGRGRGRMRAAGGGRGRWLGRGDVLRLVHFLGCQDNYDAKLLWYHAPHWEEYSYARSHAPCDLISHVKDVAEKVGGELEARVLPVVFQYST